MLRYCVIDIESLPTDRQDVKDYLAKTVKHPATHKKPETIEKWYIEEGPAAAAEAASKTGLDGSFGRVCVVGLAMTLDAAPEAIYGLDESVLLQELNCKLDTIPKNEWLSTCLIGFNHVKFDLPFLMKRYVVNGIRPHQIIKRAAEAKPWDEDKVVDVMLKWNGQSQNTISLDRLCLALNIQSPKDGFDGSMVAQAVAEGRIEDVANYCKNDIRATREAYKRLTFQ